MSCILLASISAALRARSASSLASSSASSSFVASSVSKCSAIRLVPMLFADLPLAPREMPCCLSSAMAASSASFFTASISLCLSASSRCCCRLAARSRSSFLGDCDLRFSSFRYASVAPFTSPSSSSRARLKAPDCRNCSSTRPASVAATAAITHLPVVVLSQAMRCAGACPETSTPIRLAAMTRALYADTNKPAVASFATPRTCPTFTVLTRASTPSITAYKVRSSSASRMTSASIS
mmetsp:Transcript_18452/g.35105  ORF Transcript_18452/g.35105 Transcript_18452/m.35105 type:complete len:238 (-) Transcript_18452:978-1691(-)